MAKANFFTDRTDGQIRVFFAGDRQLDKTSCEKPERRRKLEEALKSVANRHVQYECVLGRVATPEKAPRKAITSADRARRLREIEQEPIVQKMIEIFQGEVVRIDQPDEQAGKSKNH